MLHDQSNPIDTLIAGYEANLRESSLPNVPFHMYDLQHKRGGYAGLELETRKKLFGRHRAFKANHVKQMRKKLHA